MGKTVPSYRMILETEIGNWSGYARALYKEDREAFEQLMDMCRTFASESENAWNPIIFEPMAISIMFGQQKRTREHERRIDGLLLPKRGGA